MTGNDTISNREELFFSDGTAAGTVRPTPPSTAEYLPFYPWTAWVPFNNAVYYTACYTFWSDYQLCRYVDMPSTGIAELPVQNLNTYPNPASDVLHVGLSLQHEQEVHLSLYNIYGKEVWRMNAGIVADYHGDIEVANLPDGVYFLTMKAGPASGSHKVIISH